MFVLHTRAMEDELQPAEAFNTVRVDDTDKELLGQLGQQHGLW